VRLYLDAGLDWMAGDDPDPFSRHPSDLMQPASHISWQAGFRSQLSEG
jgi:hypothetical protein